MNKIIKNSIILFIITLIAGVMLGTVYEITKEPRKLQAEKATMKAYKNVFADAKGFDKVDYDNDSVVKYLQSEGYSSEIATIDGVVAAKDGSDNYIGYVITVTDKKGYGGDITFTIGITSEGIINAISFLTLDETAGMGMKAKDDNFKNQFKGLNVSEYDTSVDSYAANGIDAISGATITTKAVSNGVNAGVICFKYLSESGGADDE